MKRTTDKQQQDRRKTTPQQIRDRCQKIQEEWSETTRRRRTGQRHARWTVPEARVAISSGAGILIDGSS